MFVRISGFFFGSMFLLLSGNSFALNDALSNQKIKKILIQKSINSYSGNCPCPYNTTRNGSRCGGRSAWSRKGGYAPLCYERDVSDDAVKRYRAR